MKMSSLKQRVSKCGLDCSNCPWGPYPRNGMTVEEFQQYRDRSKTILGYKPVRTPCATCQTPDEEIPKQSKLPNRKCLIRQCVDKTGITNCAYCTRFPCDTVNATASLWNRQTIEAKLGVPLSAKDYQSFVEPFEGIKRLTKIHKALKPHDLVEPAKLTVKSRLVAFPQNLTTTENLSSFKAVHKLLVTISRSPLGLHNTDTFAQRHTLEKRKAHLLRFLWILGAYGKFEIEETAYLVVDAETYQANRGTEKTLSIWPFVEDVVFKTLAQFGVRCERLVLKGVTEDELITGTGYLRKRGWLMKLWLEEDVGYTALKALNIYATELKRRYSSAGFQRFRKADMRRVLET